MVLNQVDSTPIPDGDDSTVDAAITPPGTDAPDLVSDDDDTLDYNPFDDVKPSSSLLVPWPGSIFIIRSVSSGHVITLLDGQIVLTRPGGRGCHYWACEETKGWLGFRSPVSGKLLGHDIKGWLCCTAEQQKKWEYFCVRVRPEGGCVLLMTHYERLWHVGMKEGEEGVEKLAKTGDGASDGMIWEFARG